jgi:hypothetical protein
MCLAGLISFRFSFYQKRVDALCIRCRSDVLIHSEYVKVDVTINFISVRIFGIDI